MGTTLKRRNPADGPGSEGASLGGGMREQDNPQIGARLFLARVALDAAKAQLDVCAVETDNPAWQVVEAADLLDAAHAALDGVP